MAHKYEAEDTRQQRAFREAAKQQLHSRILQLHSEGLEARYIAERVGKTPNMVSALIRRIQAIRKQNAERCSDCGELLAVPHLRACPRR